MRVVISDLARADIREIGDYIAKDSPLRALSFIAELEMKAMQIGDMPFASPCSRGTSIVAFAAVSMATI